MRENDIPAFPGHSSSYEGMTLRDFFAGQALCGFMMTFKPPDAPRTPEQKQAVSDLCYGVADAMLLERSK